MEKNANVRYVEKHYGEGEGTGARVLNPVTEVYLGENSVFTLDTAQIKESILQFVKIMYIWKPVPSFMSLKN